ncbi:MAG: methionyl-tRNA formyltransferase, partial [Bacillota bacterium]|nr:methionyl-tRNA formyltransferase [Bacillota bacterium]
MRIVFMGTPDFAKNSLQALINSGENVVAVYTQPDRPKGRGKNISYSPVKQLALDYEIPIFQPRSLRDSHVYSELQKLAPDLIVVVAFGQILPTAILDLPAYGCINVHASLLPKYRGAAPIHWAVINGETVTGITIMYMSESLDAGDIILQEQMNITPIDTTGVIHDKLAVLGGKLLLQTIKLIKQQGSCPRTKQNDA